MTTFVKSDGTVVYQIPVNSSGVPQVEIAGAQVDVDVDVSTLATHAKQDTGNTSLSSIDTKLSSQATAANQSTANTSLSAINTDTTAIKTSLATATFSTPAAVTCTGSATALASGAAVKGVRVQADYANTTNVRVGDSNISTTRGIQLAPGDVIFIETANASNIYQIAESGSPKINVLIS